MTENRILVTGIGGIGGANFVASLRLAEQQTNSRFFIAGTEFNPHYIDFADVNVRIRTPRHSDPEFIPILLDAIKKYNLTFIHSQPSVEAKLVSEKRKQFSKVNMYLPKPEDIMPDKLYIYSKIAAKDPAAVPRTIHVKTASDVARAFSEMGSPLWIRASSGAGGRLGLKVNNAEEANLWIKLNVMQKRARDDEFLISEYLPGRDLAFDSLWYEGKMVLCYLRERLEYPFRHISLSGITGTPSVARTLHDSRIKKLGIASVLALDSNPHGFFSVDIKEDNDGNPKVTEVDGKWHTTAPLWGHAFSKAYGKPEFNLAYAYVNMATEGFKSTATEDIFPPDHFLIRQMDSGVILKNGSNKWKII